MGSIKPGTWGVIVLIALLIAGGVMGQLQQSGGSGTAVTISSGTVTAVTAITNALPAGTNLMGKVGIDQTTPGTTNGVVVNSGTITTVSAVTAITNALPTGANVIGTVNVIPKTTCGNTLATGSTLAAMPTSSTLVTTAATACATVALFSNTNASAGTVTLTDNTGTPINAVLTFSIPANSNLILPLYGIAFNLGIKWTASGAGFTGAVVSYQ